MNVKKFSLGFFLTCTALCLVLIVSNRAQAEGLSNEQGEAILNELKEIRLLLERLTRPAVPSAKVKVLEGQGYSMGKEEAPLTLVEFTDYQCPFCSTFHRETFPKLKENYIDTGKLRFISRDLPLDFHQNAFEAARAARCAGDQDNFWSMHDLLSSNPENLGLKGLTHYARELNLDMKQFEDCLTSGKYRVEIQRDIAAAQAAGFRGTPAFVLGKTSKGSIEGIRIAGAKPYAVFEEKLEALLAGILN